MDAMQPTAEVAELRDRVRAFVDERVIPAEPQLDGGDRELMRSLQDEAKEQGLWALGLPEEIGGGGLGFMPYVFVNEIVGRSEHAMIALGTHSAQDATMLHLFGTDEQKERWLRPLVAGEIYPSIGMTEPEVAGSDPTGVRATAVLDGEGGVVQANKWFKTGASTAAFTTVFAVTEPDAPPHGRASMIIVPTDSPGYEIVREIPTMGDTSGAHCEIRLTDVRVPAGNLLGPRGQAFKIAQARLGDKQTVQNWIADSAAEIQAARLMTLDVAQKIDSGDDARLEIARLKFFGAKVLHDVIDRAIQVHGALGVSGDTPLERMYRHARYARIYDGPDEVHRMS